MSGELRRRRKSIGITAVVVAVLTALAIWNTDRRPNDLDSGTPREPTHDSNDAGKSGDLHSAAALGPGPQIVVGDPESPSETTAAASEKREPRSRLRVIVQPVPGRGFRLELFVGQKGSTRVHRRTCHVAEEPVVIEFPDLLASRPSLVVLFPESGKVLPMVRRLVPAAPDHDLELWPQVASGQFGVLRTSDGKPCADRMVRIVRTLPGVKPVDWVQIKTPLGLSLTSRFVQGWSWASSDGRVMESRLEYDASTAEQIEYALTDAEGRFDISSGLTMEAVVQVLGEVEGEIYATRIRAPVVFETRTIPGSSLIVELPDGR